MAQRFLFFFPLSPHPFPTTQKMLPTPSPHPPPQPSNPPPPQKRRKKECLTCGKESKYTCPSCYASSCSLACVKKHKESPSCPLSSSSTFEKTRDCVVSKGIAPSLAPFSAASPSSNFIPLKSFTDDHLLKGFSFLFFFFFFFFFLFLFSFYPHPPSFFFSLFFSFSFPLFFFFFFFRLSNVGGN